MGSHSRVIIMNAKCYQLNAKAIVQLNVEAQFEPNNLTVGLLVAPPSPEGGDVVELTSPGYARQPIRLAAASTANPNRTWRSVDRAAFGPALEWPQATHAAIFNSEGQVVGYSTLLSSPGFAEANEVTFAPGAIQFRV